MSSLNKQPLKAIGLIALLLLVKSSLSQNLIQNASFESYIVNANHCATNFSMVNVWDRISSPDHFNSLCTLGNYGVPNNSFGVVYPMNGSAYIGIASYYKGAEVKEYIFQHLSTPLIAGKAYYTSFYISKADRVGYAIKNIGANFSVSQPSVAVSNTYIPATPQVQNQTGFLSDTTAWTKIEGYFTALGGEEYMAIGNFNSNADTDTLYVGTTNPIPFDSGMSYYYIDSVSLYDSLTYVTGINESKQEAKFNLYPNPNNGSFALNYDLGNSTSANVTVFDAKGVEIIRIKLINSSKQTTISSDKFTNGLYYYTIRPENGKPITNKFVIIK